MSGRKTIRDISPVEPVVLDEADTGEPGEPPVDLERAALVAEVERLYAIVEREGWRSDASPALQAARYTLQEYDAAALGTAADGNDLLS